MDILSILNHYIRCPCYDIVLDDLGKNGPLSIVMVMSVANHNFFNVDWCDSVTFE